MKMQTRKYLLTVLLAIVTILTVNAGCVKAESLIDTYADEGYVEPREEETGLEVTADLNFGQLEYGSNESNRELYVKNVTTQPERTIRIYGYQFKEQSGQSYFAILDNLAGTQVTVYPKSVLPDAVKVTSIGVVENLAVGSYSATLVLQCGGDTEAYIPVTVEIIPKKVSLTMNNSIWYYGDEVQSTITGAEGLSAEDYVIKYREVNSGNWTEEKPTRIGKYQAKLEVTNENYTTSEAIVDFEIKPCEKEIKIIANSSNHQYDGKAYTDNGYKITFDGEEILDGKLLYDDAINNVIVNGSVTDVVDNSSNNNKIDKDAIIITNKEFYNNIKYVDGTIEITKIPNEIVVTAADATKEYDKESPLTAKNYTFTQGILISGDKLTATISGEQQYAGESKSEVIDVKVMRGQKDITRNYTFGKHKSGTLKVNATTLNINLQVYDIYVQINQELSVDEIKSIIKCNLEDYYITYSGSVNKKYSTFDEENGFKAGDVEEVFYLDIVAPKIVDINNDGTPEYEEVFSALSIHVVNKEILKISGIEDNQEFIFDGGPQGPSGEIIVEGGKFRVDQLEVRYQSVVGIYYDEMYAPPTSPGKYKVTYKIPDSNTDYMGSATFYFTIKKKQLTKVTISGDTSFEYTGEEFSPAKSESFDEMIMDWDGDTAKTNIGDYEIRVSLLNKQNYEWDDSTTDTLELRWSITRKKLKMPTVSGEYEYKDRMQTVELNGFDSTTMEIRENTGWNAGTYNVIVILKDRANYSWENGENYDLEIPWKIEKINPTYYIPQFLSGIEGEKLESVELEEIDNGIFTWNEPETILTAGMNKYKATFTPKDATNYNEITDVDIEIRVKGYLDVITSVAGGNGTISDSITNVLEDEEVEIIFTPDNGYVINKVLINGENYTSEVKNNKLLLMPEEDINVVVSYKKKSTGNGGSSSTTTYKITVTEGKNGSITPNGVVKVEKGEDQTFKIKAEKGYEIADVLVDGKSVGAVAKYTFKNVKAKHTIEATFKKVEMPEQKPEEKETFKDVKKNDWYYEAVEYVANKGLMNGTGNDEFTPDANTTRGMIVTILYRLEGSPEVSMSTFTDVANTEYYAKAVAWAEKNGIVNGYGEGKFGPNDVITREQLAAIMYRYSNYKKYNTSVGEDTNILSYNDISELSEYAVSSMQWACGAGLVNGIGDGKLAPKGNATRAQLATILMRYCESNK